MINHQTLNSRVLLVAPTGKDARLSQAILADAGIDCTICPTIAAVCAEVAHGAGAVILTEEALSGDHMQQLSAMLAEQPPWSDLPILLLHRGGAESGLSRSTLAALGNVMLLDRPVRITTLVSAVRSALRARERQYQIREHLREREQASEQRAQLYASEQRARADAEAAVQVREIFLSIAAHELKTPLTSLLGNVQLVERRIAKNAGLSERDRRAVQIASQQGRRLQQMIDALLDASRLEFGQLSITQAPLDLCALVDRIVQEVQPGLTNHSVVCAVPAAPIEIFGDELRLEQVLQNLIQNAIKYSPAGGTVVVTVERHADQALVHIRDHGLGIPAAALPRLFERFYRVPNAADRHIQGVGIGLYVVKEIVTLHGGSIDVVSQEGQGSTFTVRLPLLASQQADQSEHDRPAVSAGGDAMLDVEASQAPKNVPSSQPASHILVVDDDPAIRAMLTEVLAYEGYDVVSAGNGYEAMQHLLESNMLPQLIILDLMMPIMNGWDFLAQQQQNTALAPVPVVVISAGASAQEQPVRSACARFLPKPIDLDLLLEIVHRYSN